MTGDTLQQDDTQVLSAIADADCRSILLATAEAPRTVPEIVEYCGIPTVTAYRKVNYLANTGLLEETMRIQPNGRNASAYTLNVASIRVGIAGDSTDGFTCSVTPRTEQDRTGDHQRTPILSTDGGEDVDENDGSDSDTDASTDSYGLF